MIHEAVNFVQKELQKQLEIPATDVIVGNINDLKEQNNQKGLYISLVNIQEEESLKNVPHTVRINGKQHYKEPPVHLNIFLLFSFAFDKYETSLQRLSQVIELFQNKRVYSKTNASTENPFPGVLQKLIFDLSSLDFEKLNYLWGILGGSYYPSVLYKVRMIRIQKDESLAGPEITNIEVNTGLI